MKKYLQQFLRACLSSWSRAIDGLAEAGIVLSIMAMLYSSFVLVSLTATQLTVSLGRKPVLRDHTDWLLAKLGVEVEKLTDQQYVGVLSVAIGTVAVLVTLWFSFATLVKYIQQHRELLHRSVIKKEAVRLDGVDDLNVMLRYFKMADEVTVFSGDFSWLSSNSELLRHIRRLAKEKKIRFVTYKDEGDIKDAIGSLFSEFQSLIRFRGPAKLKCSLVSVGQSRVFLYKVDRTAEGGDKSVCVLSSREDARYLLESLDALCNQYARGS